MAKAQLSKIQFHYLYKSFEFRDRNWLKQFILQLLKREGKDVETINYIFCDDEYLLDINRQYLRHNYYTDIITFELSMQGQPLLADIFISVERLRENAESFNAPFCHELHRVIFHGALHLAGYGDKTDSQIVKMRHAENACIRNYFVSREKKQAKY